LADARESSQALIVQWAKGLAAAAQTVQASPLQERRERRLRTSGTWARFIPISGKTFARHSK
jgi:hypothetical protein